MAHPPPVDAPEAKPRRWPIPAWAASLLAHLVIFVALGMTLQFRVMKGLAGDSSGPEIAGEIVLKHHNEQGEFYESQGSAHSRQNQANSSTDSATNSGPSLDSVLGNAPSQPSVSLPSGDIGPAKAGGGEIGGAGALTGGAAPKRSSGGGTSLAFMNIDSQGNSFVFVIDRSASMSQSGRLAAAKAELLGAIRKLDKTNQFQLIFFNQGTELFRPLGNRAFTAEDSIKNQAERFIRGISADGASDGFASALRMAVHYHPDVIYFLTDAEDLTFSDVELAGISRSSYGTTIHTIKFGEGAEERIPWMIKLASQNSGKYLYVDSRGFAGK